MRGARVVVGDLVSAVLPCYVGVLASAAAVTPEPVLNAIRRLVRDNRALRPDSQDRVAYRASINAQTRP